MIKPSQQTIDSSYVKDYEKLYSEVQADPETFWENIARELSWFKPWNKVLEWKYPYARWFVGGQTNIVHNALDRHQKTATKDKLAYIWVGQDMSERRFTYGQLNTEVCKFANALKSLGIRKGDRITIYLPRIPEQFIAMLSCAKIGAVHSVVFSGFSADALKNRIMDAQSKIVITTDKYPYKDKVLDSKKTVEEAIKEITSVQHIILVDRMNQNYGKSETQKTGNSDESDKNNSELSDNSDVNYHWYDELMASADTICSTEIMEATDALFLLYTSGSTGKPKGVLHSHGGYMVGTYITLKWVFDIRNNQRLGESEIQMNQNKSEVSDIPANPGLRPSDDIWFCTADAGWITGHSYIVYSPLINGATSLVYEATPDYPHTGIWWELIQKYKVTKFYTAPTAVRSLMRLGNDIPDKYDLSSLIILGSVGEPINPEAWLWYYKVIGKEKCPVMDTWWQTETGMFMLTPLPSVPLKPGSCFKPFPGVETDIVDEHANPVEVNKQGFLVIRKPWPSMLLDVYNNPKKYLETYFENENLEKYSESKHDQQTETGIASGDKNAMGDASGRAPDPASPKGFEGQAVLAARPSVASAKEAKDNERQDPSQDLNNFLYFTGDSAKKDEDGYFWIIGRNDDVIKVSGHRLGSAELESAFVAHPAVAEAAVIGKPDEIKGEKIKAFVILKKGNEPGEELKKELIQQVRKMIGPIATPDELDFVDMLPKTRSGKIMRRVLKAQELGQPLGDTSTLEN
ncbi:hypothetical protein A2774_04695 [Candidatus Roizmanbacteria bacterium RIFCSPHIGHO2_01_FULL_39_12c]|uniref:acetate--CoA ligase n=1 Tax=Candidatus Roizmanbacteria bacterium RIFCSPHIGHO2_01_FULL_39_12c TaxID=1802031 RepID=A0A1F7GFA7_9BACT|nr:MAG: hypothetical protein A2774_04695 [Candidatus Roizmanbacteria bacterium RIFCSPHIGHO2_01_FULL_39_12c]OGK46227.1 MAG: hypothetical protein A2963_02050 [Candidatus Roizmanbacteria bacterium RIFCSPLOWO2_01_FULL_40_13]